METFLQRYLLRLSPILVLIPLPLTGMETYPNVNIEVRVVKSFNSFTPHGDGNVLRLGSRT